MRKNKIYFASDFHLGIPNRAKSFEREKKIIQWLETIQPDAEEIFLLGDIFDFWFEYKKVIPKGFVRLQGKIAELTDQGVPIHVFTGNHDMWMFDYFPQELGVHLHNGPIKRKIHGKVFYIGHGDGLGPGDKGYKALKKIFSNSWSQFLFQWIHPDVGIGMADYWSRKSRLKGAEEEEKYLGEEKEWLVLFCKEMLEREKIDFFIFGHRHLPLEVALPQKSKYINLGDWISHYTYAEFDREEVRLKEFKK